MFKKNIKGLFALGRGETVMKKFKKALGDLARDESGQTAVEYMLILAVIVGVIFALGDTFKKRFTGLVNSVFNSIDRKVKNL